MTNCFLNSKSTLLLDPLAGAIVLIDFSLQRAGYDEVATALKVRIEDPPAPVSSSDSPRPKESKAEEANAESSVQDEAAASDKTLVQDTPGSTKSTQTSPLKMMTPLESVVKVVEIKDAEADQTMDSPAKSSPVAKKSEDGENSGVLEVDAAVPTPAAEQDEDDSIFGDNEKDGSEDTKMKDNLDEAKEDVETKAPETATSPTAPTNEQVEAPKEIEGTQQAEPQPPSSEPTDLGTLYTVSHPSCLRVYITDGTISGGMCTKTRSVWHNERCCELVRANIMPLMLPVHLHRQWQLV